MSSSGCRSRSASCRRTWPSFPRRATSRRAHLRARRLGITIRGSIGIELPCFGVPVLTAGTGFYSGRGFTVDSASRAEYLARLAPIEELPPLTDREIELARRHAYALFRLRPTALHELLDA